MEQITKEYLAQQFEQQFEKQFVRLTGYIDGRLENFATKEYLNEKLTELKVYVDDKVDGVVEAMDHRFNEVDERFNQVDHRLVALEVEVKAIKNTRST